MSQVTKTSIIVLAVAGIVSTPLVWLLGSPDGGQMVGASVQAAVAIAALVWALFQQPGSSTDDTVEETGEAQASGGGSAITGIKRPGGRGSGSAKATHTGDANSTGEGSSASSGIDYS